MSKQLFLKNISEIKSITLRYGEGLNRAIQLLPGETKDLPLEMTKDLLQSYLHLFDFVKVVEEKVEEKKDEELDSEVVDTVDNNNPEGESSGQDNTQQSGSTETDKSNEGEGSSSTDSDQSDSNQDVKTSSVSSETNFNPEENKIIKYTEKQLTKLSAEEVKEIAKSLNIEVMEDSTKKALIPVILNKQDEIK